MCNIVSLFRMKRGMPVLISATLTNTFMLSMGILAAEKSAKVMIPVETIKMTIIFLEPDNPTMSVESLCLLVKVRWWWR